MQPQTDARPTGRVVLDFETYSEAGAVWDPVKRVWLKIKKGSQAESVGIVGAWAYSEHPSTEVNFASFRWATGHFLWAPGMPLPQWLLDYMNAGGIIEAHSSFFEVCMWHNVCVPKYGWPAVRLSQIDCTLARAGAHALPRGLNNALLAMNAPVLKDQKGRTVMLKLSKPRKPTKKDPRTRFTRAEEPEAFAICGDYCNTDTKGELWLSDNTPELSPYERNVWLLDQKINFRGVPVDYALVGAGLRLIKQAYEHGTAELQQLTGGAVETATQGEALRAWLGAQGLPLPDMTKDTVAEVIARDDLPPHLRRVLEIRKSLSLASVQKLHAMRCTRSKDDRIRGMFQYCGADTWRWAGRLAQPHNITKGSSASEELVADIMTGDFYYIQTKYGDVFKAVSNCLRACFCAPPGHEFICADYSAIEAVVLAVLAREQWRIDVFNGHGKIYETGASKITGVPLQDYLDHRERTGEHHPDRAAIGKVFELACGYQGGVGACINFGADKFMDEATMKDTVYKWRDASPNIVAFWEGVQAAAISATSMPGTKFWHNDVFFRKEGNVLRCWLPSGRPLTYHNPRLTQGHYGLQLKYSGYRNGQWGDVHTYGGKLTENIIQAVARDILAHGLLNAEATGCNPILHVHDEIVGENPIGTVPVERLEAAMNDLPPWAAGWPVRAAGGWTGQRYRKD